MNRTVWHSISMIWHHFSMDQYARGNDLPHLRFIQPANGTLTAARLALVQANAQVLATGLNLLGVLAPSEMR